MALYRFVSGRWHGAVTCYRKSIFLADERRDAVGSRVAADSAQLVLGVRSSSSSSRRRDLLPLRRRLPAIPLPALALAIRPPVSTRRISGGERRPNAGEALLRGAGSPRRRRH